MVIQPTNQPIVPIDVPTKIKEMDEKLNFILCRKIY